MYQNCAWSRVPTIETGASEKGESYDRHVRRARQKQKHNNRHSGGGSRCDHLPLHGAPFVRNNLRRHIPLRASIEAASCVDGPQLARVIFVRSAGRLQSCVRPFGAVAHDRWPWWVPRVEALSVGRDWNPAEAVRLLSIRRVDRLCHHVFFTLASLRHAAAQVVMLRLLRVGRGPVCSWWPKPCEPFCSPTRRPRQAVVFGWAAMLTRDRSWPPSSKGAPCGRCWRAGGGDNCPLVC